MRIEKEDRRLDFLQSTVNKLYECIKQTEAELYKDFPALKPFLPKTLKFITANELHEMFPGLDVHDRETVKYCICNFYRCV